MKLQVVKKVKMSSIQYHSKMVPNILIYCDNAEQFLEMKTTLKSLIGNHSYTIYKISTSELAKSSVWMNNCSLLINTEPLNDQLNKYLQDGGRILSIVTNNQLFQESELNGKKDISNEVIERCPVSEGAHYITKVN